MEKLYNNINLPDQWPPRYDLSKNKDEIEVPYLKEPPKTITIDVGRQLFVDDFLIESTNMKRCYHNPVKFEGNPVLKPETCLEKGGRAFAMPCATPKSGGVWWDTKDKIFKMWYEAGWLYSMAYATSEDGIDWKRPVLKLSNISENNQILPNFRPDSTTIIIDDTSKKERYKMFLRAPEGGFPGVVATSSDGIDWTNFAFTNPMGDRTTIFYNPFRKKWIYSIRTYFNGRSRSYRECDDLIQGAKWSKDEEYQWLRTDELDIPDAKINFQPQLYNVDAVAYESIMLGAFQIHMGPENSACEKSGEPKITEIMLMYSRDGFHWSRPCREPFITAARHKDAWDRGYIQSVGGVCIIKDDELWFYYIGFQGDQNNSNHYWDHNGMYANGATGIAKLRRDGFASLNPQQTPGEIITNPVQFTHGKYLFVNINGKISAEILDENNNIIEPYSFENCNSIDGDYTKRILTWNEALSKLHNQTVKFRFKIESGDFYSFWISDTKSGKSDGYLAGGEVGKLKYID